MVIPRPGITYQETTTTIPIEGDLTQLLCFVVQTSEKIASIDNQLILFESLEAFKEVADGKGLTKTIQFIDQVVAGTGQTAFYVYSVKTDTAAGFTEAVKSSAAKKEVTRIIYFEENTSSESNTIQTKSAALASACHTTSEQGAFKVAYVIPDASHNVELAKEGKTTATSLTSLVGASDGRLYFFSPNNASNMVSHVINTAVGTEPGYEYISGIVGAPDDFTPDEMDLLRNKGVNFLQPERINGELQYRIHVGVTTNAQNSKSDSLIVAREVNDALLREIDTALAYFIKGKQDESTQSLAQTTINGIVNTYTTDGLVTKDTKLTVAVKDQYTFQITGTIVPTSTLLAIEVNTVIG